jgi:hypothetical protein
MHEFAILQLRTPLQPGAVRGHTSVCKTIAVL